MPHVTLVIVFNLDTALLLPTGSVDGMLHTWLRNETKIFYMMTSLNDKISALLVHCEGNPPVTGGFPSQRPVSRSFDVIFDLCLNKPLSEKSRRWWLETPSRSLWRHCNETTDPKVAAIAAFDVVSDEKYSQQRAINAKFWCSLVVSRSNCWANRRIPVIWLHCNVKLESKETFGIS